MEYKAGVYGFEPEIDDHMEDKRSEVLSTVKSRKCFVAECPYESWRGRIEALA
jgi:hypothetical protein